MVSVGDRRSRKVWVEKEEINVVLYKVERAGLGYKRIGASLGLAGQGKSSQPPETGCKREREHGAEYAITALHLCIHIPL